MDYRDNFFTLETLANMVRDICLDHVKLPLVSSLRKIHDTGVATWAWGATSRLACWAVSSVASSSISVPFDVTGDGPTMSLLGLVSWAGLGLVKVSGRRDLVSGPVEDLRQWRDISCFYDRLVWPGAAIRHVLGYVLRLDRSRLG